MTNSEIAVELRNAADWAQALPSKHAREVVAPLLRLAADRLDQTAMLPNATVPR